MKCPKCEYLGFEQVDRCRNCGYDFSLARVENAPELSLRNEHGFSSPIDDLALVDDATAPLKESSSAADLYSEGASGSGQSDPDQELPLFGSIAPGDGPLITRASAPRQPLAVRRATPEVHRLRSTPSRTAMLDLAAPDPPQHPSRRTVQVSDAEPENASINGAGEVAGMVERFIAVAIDLGMLALVDVAVIYFTMQICGLTFDDLRILPKGPLIVFLILQNGGYLVIFTAGGQTLGKMVAGIRVVSADPNEPLAFGQSLIRTLVWLVLAVPAGLGLLTALLTPDRRGLHDRCAGTKVVRASA